MNNAIAKSTIVAAAIGLLWDGGDDRDYYYGKNRVQKFGCHAVSMAHADITGCSFDRSRENETVLEIHARITKYIGGYGTARGYMYDVLGIEGITDESAQAFRKKMLQDILAEYEKKELLQRQIEVLNKVKELRVNNPARSNYVCDNINSGYYGNRGLNLKGTPEATAICEDIRNYIGGAFSVDEWLGMEDKHAEVEPERIKMIDTLIERYTAQLEAA